MASSRGEIKIKEILENNGIIFEREYAFSDLKSVKGNPLRFDFAIFCDDGTLDFLVEFQGIQHYIPKDNFGGEFGLKRQQIYDSRKREYCTKNKIPLVEIPYWMEARMNFDYIINKAKEAIEKLENESEVS